MKKIFVVLEIVVVLITSTACNAKGDTPFSYPLTKWSGNGFELYVDEQGKGFLIFKTSKEAMVFDADFLFGHLLRIYKHRDAPDQTIELVWEYFSVMSFKDRPAFSTAHFKDEAYSDIFPDKLVFRKQCDITSADIKYEFFEVEKDNLGEIVQPNSENAADD